MKIDKIIFHNFKKNNIKFFKKAREFLKQEALKEISEATNFSLFHRRVFCVVVKYGLQSTAKEEGLLSGDEWSNYPCL